jgi:hypothetical protein
MVSLVGPSSPCRCGPRSWRRMQAPVPYQCQAQANCQWHHGRCMTLQAFPPSSCPSSPPLGLYVRAACRIAGLPRWAAGWVASQSLGCGRSPENAPTVRPHSNTTGTTSIASTLPKANSKHPTLFVVAWPRESCGDPGCECGQPMMTPTRAISPGPAMGLRRARRCWGDCQPYPSC